jgi:hypothetical protein
MTLEPTRHENQEMEVAKVEGYIFVPDTTTLFIGYQLTIRL